MKNLITIVALLISISIITNAQVLHLTNNAKLEAVPDDSDFSVSFSPQHFIISGFKICVEKRISDQASVLISPEVYLKKQQDGDETVGVGLFAHHRVYLTEQRQTYLAYGGGYNFFNINYYNYVWYEDGDYYHYADKEIDYKISRVRLDLMLGAKFSGKGRLFVDMYMGAGLQYSIHNSEDSMNRFDQYMIDYGFTGPIILIGARFGVNFKKK